MESSWTQSPDCIRLYLGCRACYCFFLFSLSLEIEIFFKLVFTHQCLHKGLFKIRAWQRVDIVGSVETGKRKPGWISVNRLSVRAELVNCGYLSVPRKTGNRGL